MHCTAVSYSARARARSPAARWLATAESAFPEAWVAASFRRERTCFQAVRSKAWRAISSRAVRMARVMAAGAVAGRDVG